jgi:hypothetical protein
VTWQVFGGVGCELTQHVDLELGWRHLAMDYEEDGMVVDATLSGLTMSAAINF